MEYWSVGVVSLRKLLCTHGAFLCSRFAVRSVASPTGRRLQEKSCASEPASELFEPTFGRGCSSVVEHLLAKEDVASSSLVTRSLSAGRGCSPESPETSPSRSGEVNRPCLVPAPTTGIVTSLSLRPIFVQIRPLNAHFLESELAFLCIS
jgi:hypothetical protein